MNSVQLKGNVSRDPELRFASNGSAVCGFGLAVPERYQKNGEWHEGQTVFIDVTLFGKGAERVNGLVQKGASVIVTGKLKFETWDDKSTGTKRQKVSVHAFTVDLVQKPQRQDSQESQEDTPW